WCTTGRPSAVNGESHVARHGDRRSRGGHTVYLTGVHRSSRPNPTEDRNRAHPSTQEKCRLPPAAGTAARAALSPYPAGGGAVPPEGRTSATHQPRAPSRGRFMARPQG